MSLLVTDLDGTFWENDSSVPRPHLDAVAQINALGIPILAATARRPRHVVGPFRSLGLDLPYVCIDGAIGVDGSLRFVDRSFPSGALAACLSAMALHDIRPCLYVLDEQSDIVLLENPSTCQAHLEFIAQQSRSVAAKDVAALKVYAMSILGVDRDQLQASFDTLSRRNDVEAVLAPEPGYGKWALTLTPSGVDKWTAVEAFTRHRAIDLSNVAVVGDGANDIPLLRNARHSIAVNGGHPGAVALADHVVASPAENGWASLPDLLATL